MLVFFMYNVDILYLSLSHLHICVAARENDYKGKTFYGPILRS